MSEQVVQLGENRNKSADPESIFKRNSCGGEPIETLVDHCFDSREIVSQTKVFLKIV